MKNNNASSVKRPAKVAARQSSRGIMSAELLADSLGGASAMGGALDASRDNPDQAAKAAYRDDDDDASHDEASHEEMNTLADVHAGHADRKAAHVDADARTRNLKRLRRIEGQVRGLQKMVEDDRYCADIMTQIASVHEALRSVGRELMRNHLKHCATGAIQAGEPTASAMYDELVDMMYKHSR